jgi:hypothetical protein
MRMLCLRFVILSGSRVKASILFFSQTTYSNILFINHLIEINSYKFVVKYLQENRPDTHQRSTAEEINRSIQSTGICDGEESTDYRKKHGIRSQARNWLRKFGYDCLDNP